MAGYRFLALILFAPILAAQDSISFSFTVPPSNDNTRVSAAVLDANGVMIKQILGAQQYAPGTYTVQWDGSYDTQGTATHLGTYTIKVLMNQVRYKYDGHLFGTGKDWYNLTGRWEQFCPYTWGRGFAKIVFAGQRAFVACQYNEAAVQSMTFLRNDPNNPSRIDPSYQSSAVSVPNQYQINDAATDGTWVYMMTGPNSQPTTQSTLVFPLDAATGQPVFFSPSYSYLTNTLFGGTSYKPGTFIDCTNSTAPPTGCVAPASPTTAISVQRNSSTCIYPACGNLLAVAHGLTNTINLFDKTTGQCLAGPYTGCVSGAITGISSPQKLAFTSEGLWVISQNSGTGSMTTGPSPNILTLTPSSASSFNNGDEVTVQGAGTSGYPLVASVISGGGTTSLTLSANAVASVINQPVTNTSRRYLSLITGLPSAPVITLASALANPITGLVNPVAIASNPLTNRLYVADGGTNQQIFGYDITTHTNSRTLGVAGGMNDCNPNISHTRFAFDSYPYNGTNDNGTVTGRVYFTWISVDDDDGLWVQDLQGVRVQHFDAGNNYVNRILSMRPNYFIMASETMPTRVFKDMIEYSINYNVPLVPGDPDPALGGNGAWDMVRDWQICAFKSPPQTVVSPMNASEMYFTSVEQVTSNGNTRVYAQGRLGPAAIWELPANGLPARNTGVVQPYIGARQVRNGDYNLAFCNAGACRSNSVVVGSTITYSKYPLQSIDANNNPVYGSLVNLITAHTDSTDYLMVNNTSSGKAYGGELSTNGYFPYFYAESTGSPTGHNATILRYPHMAAIKTGFPGLAWHNLPETNQYIPSFRGEFPAKPSTTYVEGALPVFTEQNNFFVLYTGNNAINGNQIFHYFEDGMLVGQFGNIGGPPPGYFSGFFYNVGAPNNPTNFGNSILWSVISMNNGNDIYVYMSDETFSMGQRWHITNLGSIHEFAGSGILQPNGSATLTQVF